jgi:hypothetical protein
LPELEQTWALVKVLALEVVEPNPSESRVLPAGGEEVL